VVDMLCNCTPPPPASPLPQARDSVPLDQWGYVCTMNKPQEDSSTSNYSALFKQSSEELQFFKDR